MPGKSRNYVAIVTGWTTDEWASEVAAADGGHHYSAGRILYSARQSNLGSKEEAKRIATYKPRWGIWLAAPLMESKAWAISVFTKNGVRCSDGNAVMGSRD